MLLAAGERALAVSAEVGGVALAIDAKDPKAAGWYMHRDEGLGATGLVVLSCVAIEIVVEIRLGAIEFLPA